MAFVVEPGRDRSGMEDIGLICMIDLGKFYVLAECPSCYNPLYLSGLGTGTMTLACVPVATLKFIGSNVVSK